MSVNQSLQSGSSCFFIKNAVEQTPPVFLSNIITCLLDFFVSVTATVSNALIIHVIWRNRALHTPSNTLLGCLAVTDLLVGCLVAPLNILTKIAEIVNNEDLYCVTGVIYSIIGWSLVGMTFITLSLISVERYLAVRLHLRYIAMITTKRILTVVAFCWLYVLVIKTLRFWDTKETYIRIFIIGTMTLCVGLTVFCYYKIFALVRQHRAQIRTSCVSVSMNTRVPNLQLPAANLSMMTRQNKSTLTMVYILMFFFLCYLPLFSYQIVATTVNTREGEGSMRVAYLFTFSLAMVNSAFNPILYCLRINGLRKAVVSFIRGLLRKIE